MNRSMWISAGAVLTILAVPLLAVTQAVDKSMRGSAHDTWVDPSNSSDPYCRCSGEGDSPSVARIEQALRGRLKSQGLDFTDAPLKDLVAYIEDTYKIPVQLDIVALEEEGIDPHELVTVSLHDISLRSALRLMLKKLGLTYIVQDEVLIITSPTQAEAELVTCVYDVRDLLHRTRSDFDFDSLIDTIVSCVASETWAENGGGESDIRPLQPGFLVVSQTAEVHEEIEELLKSIRELIRRPVAAAAIVDPYASLDELVTEWNVR
jgi:hypothetical protein